MQNAGVPTVEGDALRYVGRDESGLELEIIAVPNDRGDDLAVIHAMPTEWRRR